MFCPNCGNKNPDDARFCGKCGTPLPALEEEHRNQDDGFVRSMKKTPETVSGETERVFSKTGNESPLHQEEIQKVSEASSGNLKSMGNISTPVIENQDKEATPAADTVKMISNTESWKVEPADQSIRDANPSPGRNPYYIPPATVLPKTGSQEEDAAENNTALIIIIIVLITLIILVGIIAFAYMRGYIDF